MTEKERSEKRFAVYQNCLFVMQLFSWIQTYEDFLNEFRYRMRKSEIGECTAEDEQWAFEEVSYFVKKNSEKK